MNSQTILTSHNIKMVLLTGIPIVIGILGILSKQMNTPEWIATVSAILILIEHALNGNTSEPVLPAPSV